MNVQQQGEVRIERVSEVPENLAPINEMLGDSYIISHSESGHHHVLDRAHADVGEQRNVPDGLRIIYAIVKNPTELRQTAGRPHGSAPLMPGKYRLTVSREVDSFTQQARRVAD